MPVKMSVCLSFASAPVFYFMRCGDRTGVTRINAHCPAIPVRCDSQFSLRTTHQPLRFLDANPPFSSGCRVTLRKKESRIWLFACDLSNRHRDCFLKWVAVLDDQTDAEIL